MKKVNVIISLRQMLNTANDKLNLMVKPDVVLKEYNTSRNNLCRTIEAQVTNRKELLGLMIIVNKTHINATLQGNASLLRNVINGVIRSLPSVVDSAHAKKFKK